MSIDNIDESIDDPKIPVGIAICSTHIVTIALLATAATPIGNPPITATATTTTITIIEEKRHVDYSQRLIQRIWTNENEIELLRGFLEFTTQRGSTNYNVTK
ncbi:hypothetical protein SO802_013226 [Lithocarpus litseifolius]|uniref:Uncharacterized protein n=1 Tax=Lithocarpus litseifolius TaxID=425828 RepID=A0AAW2D8Z3_9ROSI